MADNLKKNMASGKPDVQHVFKIPCPNIGTAVAIYYDRAAVLYSINYCKENHIKHPIFYILTCRIGLFIDSLVKQIKAIGGKYYLNPDGEAQIISRKNIGLKVA